MINFRLLTSFGLPLGLAATMACASRTPPTSFPDDAPASPSAEVARPAVVTRALDGEPPLPGTADAKAWSGLAGGRDEAPDAHQGHAHHHGNHGAHAPDSAKGAGATGTDAAGHEGHGGAEVAPPDESERDGGNDGPHDHHGAH